MILRFDSGFLTEFLPLQERDNSTNFAAAAALTGAVAVSASASFAN